VVVYRFPEMEEIEREWAERPLEFPYIPGLLSFREMPAILAAFERVREEPDLIYYDGQGYAHPRRMGIACHLGLLLDRPTIGCAKSRLIGRHEEPGAECGDWAPLEDRGERIGAVLRTRSGVKPIYVSPGHRIGLERAVELTLAVCDGYRIPRPTRDADHFVGAVKRGEEGEKRGRRGRGVEARRRRR
jgi:deoxyribonuclease V